MNHYTFNGATTDKIRSPYDYCSYIGKIQHSLPNLLNSLGTSYSRRSIWQYMINIIGIPRSELNSHRVIV